MEEIIQSLNILEKVEPGQKLSFSGGKITIVEKPTAIGRWYAGDSKHKTLIEVSKIVDNAMNIGVPIDTKIITALENLKVTYHKSKEIVLALAGLQKHIKNYLVQRKY
jgi:hypothetical protein